MTATEGRGSGDPLRLRGGSGCCFTSCCYHCRGTRYYNAFGWPFIKLNVGFRRRFRIRRRRRFRDRRWIINATSRYKRVFLL